MQFKSAVLLNVGLCGAYEVIISLSTQEQIEDLSKFVCNEVQADRVPR